MADDTQNAYVFEKPVPLPHGTTGRIDLYKRGCFVLEAKQGSEAWDAHLTQPGFVKKRGVARRGAAPPPAARHLGHGHGTGPRAGAELCAQPAAR